MDAELLSTVTLLSQQYGFLACSPFTDLTSTPRVRLSFYLMNYICFQHLWLFIMKWMFIGCADTERQGDGLNFGRIQNELPWREPVSNWSVYSSYGLRSEIKGKTIFPLYKIKALSWITQAHFQVHNTKRYSRPINLQFRDVKDITSINHIK